jgi:hypothetical protein
MFKYASANFHTGINETVVVVGVKCLFALGVVGLHSSLHFVFYKK